jgi:hypothetical protein
MTQLSIVSELDADLNQTIKLLQLLIFIPQDIQAPGETGPMRLLTTLSTLSEFVNAVLAKTEWV